MTQGLHDNCFQISECLADVKEAGLFCMIARVRAKTSGWQLHRSRSWLALNPGAQTIIVTKNHSQLNM